MADDQGATRHDRAPLIAFIAGAEAEAALREGLADSATSGLEIRRGTVRTAIAALKSMPSPKVLIVDVGGENHPLAELTNLSEVVEPDVTVLVIGEGVDVDFYRQVTKGLGAVEYLSKPLTRDRVARYFGPIVAGQERASEKANSGRTIAVTGARGGVGATTIAAHLAWLFAVDARRHTLLLDPDLHMGTAAFLLDGKASTGLRTALETPDRIDQLFIERAAQPVGGSASDRLHVLASEEEITEQPTYAPGAVAKLLASLHKRYSIVVADVPFSPAHLNRDLLAHAHQRVLVLEPTLASVRDALRLMSLPRGPLQAKNAVLVLNRVGLPGGLSRKQVEDALKARVDVAIVDLPKRLGMAAALGEPASVAKGPFKAGISELARQVAFERLLDSTMLAAAAPEASGRWKVFGKGRGAR